MTFTKKIQLLFFILFISNTAFSQNLPTDNVKKVKLPTHADGSPFICEKFEMLEKNLKNLQLTNTSITPPTIPGFNTASTRTDEEVQVGDSNKTEFEVHAAVNPTDPSNIIVGAMSIEGGSTNTVLNFSIYYTNDFGDTWEKSNFNGEILNDITVGGGDPMIVFDENGKAYFSWVMVTFNTTSALGTWALYYATSDNGGDNWIFNLNDAIEKETFTDIFNLSDLQEAVDKQWMVSDLTPSSPHYGNSYIAYVDIQVASENYQLKVKTREAGSTTFSSTAQIINTANYAIAQFASIDVAKNGDVYATFFASTGGTNYAIYVAKSINGGNSFAQEKKISNISFPQVFSGNTPVTGISNDRLYPCPHVAVDKSDGPTQGNIYATWTAYGVNSQATNGFDIYLSSSTDGGDTWSIPTVVNNDSNGDVHQVYSSIEVTRTGIVVVSWYDRREDAANNVFTNYYMGYSTNGGDSFEQFSVSTEASDFDKIDDNNVDLGPGEYNQIITVADYAIPFWGDGRTNNGDIAVYAAFYNLNTLSTDPEKLSTLNTKFSVQGPFPNPVQDVATLNLILKEDTPTKILLFDVAGKLVDEILNKSLEIGEHSIQIKNKNLSNGEYIVTIYTDFGILSKKITITK